nr:MAG TPA: minor tail protein [Caudoviricetes sp.]
MADAAELIVRIRGDASDLEATISGVSQQLEELERTQSNTNGVKGVRESTSAYQGLASQLKDTGKGIKEVGESIDTITKPIQYASTALAAGGVASAKFAIDFEDSFAGVKKTVDATPEQLAKIKQGIIDLSTTGIDGRGAIPQTTTELNELAAAGGQLGISQENIIDFTEVMAQMGSATNLVGEEGAATLARFQNVMGVGQNEIRNIGSAIVDLGNHSATTESEIAAMALRMGKYGSSVRMSAADVLGYSAALSSLGIEAQMGGSAIGRTWLSIETAVANGGEGLKTFAKYSGKSAKEFKEQWNTDSSGAFNGLLKGLQSAENLTVALDDLGINNTQDIQAMMALVNGYDLVTESVNRSNTAYQENTALQEEFDAKAETTASKLSVAKNNVVEIARSFGDLMLPTIVDVSNGVSQYTQKIASMDDAQKKNIITAGATVVAMGAITKGSTGLIKWAGNTVEAVGNIKKAFSAGGALAKYAPTLASIGAAAGPAVLSLGAMATATVVLYKAARKYEEYSKDWSRGGDELSNKTKSYADAARDLNSLQWELRNLQQVVNNPDTDETTLQQSKQRIEEIKNLLAEKYNMDISVNDAELDEAIEKMKRVNYLEAKQNIPDLTDYGNNKKDDYEDAKSSRELYNENVEGIKKQQQATEDYRSELLMLKDAYDKGSVSQEEFNNKFNELSEATGNPNFKNSPIEALLNSTAIEDWSKELEKNLTNNNTLISENEATMAEYEKTMRELANAGLLEMEFGDTEQGLEHITTAVKNADLSMSDWATTAALVQTGQSSLDDVWQAGGDTLNNFISNYTADMQKFGASSNEIATKAALLQNGFRSIQEASEAGALDVVTKQANDLAHSMGLIPENKNIAINASGDISIIEDVQRAVDVVNGVGDVNLQVSAEGDISVLNTADSELQELVNNNQVTIKFNVDTGGFDINDLNGDKLGEITATGKVIWTNDSTEPDNYTAPPKEGNVTFTKDSAEPDGYQPEDKFATVHYTVSVEGSSIEGLSDKSAPAAKFGSTGTFVKKAKKAKGTQNFEGGLAMVNDEKGISDPRELIIDKGRAFIPQGKDVVLPLSKGAKVYTASQTKAIMSGMGIPHYATGKDNSDAFTSAKDDWTHYTKTHAVTTAQELEKWLEFQEKFKSNDKDIADIEEQIFSIMQKQTQEFNEQSKAYLEKHSAINDWGDNGDTPLDAFKRIKDRNYQDLQDAKITWDDYVDNVSDAGETLYDDMKSYSDSWLEHQQKYHDMSIDDYIAGIDREAERLEEFYANDVINYQKYVEEKQTLEEKRYDAVAQKNADEYSAWQKDADAWQELRSTYDDWDKYGDSEEDFLKRKIDRVKEFYNAGKISFEEFIDDTNKYSMDLYKSQSSAVDELLQKQQDYISNVKEEFSKQEQELRDSWDVQDRKNDMSEVQAQLDVYANAVTDRGQQKYKELQEQMKQLQRDEELYQLQVKNNATIESLEAEYKQMEDGKKNILTGLQNADINISAYVATITDKVSATGGNIESLLSRMLDKFDSFKIENNSMSDNRKIINNFMQMTPEEKQDALNKYVGL